MSELAPTYPNVDFMADVVAPEVNPLSKKIITNVYLGAYFGQGEMHLTQKLAAEVQDHEFSYWLPGERADYHSVRQEVQTFFARDGVSLLTEASPQANHVDAPDQHVTGRKHDLLRYSWEATQQKLATTSSLAGYNYAPRTLWNRSKSNPAPHRPEKIKVDPDGSWIPPEMKEEWAELRREVGLVRDFIAADTYNITSGRGYGFDIPLHESLVRRAVLSGSDVRRLPSAGFSKLCYGMLRHIAIFGLPAYIRGNRRAWQAHHQGEEYFTEDYYDTKANRSNVDRLAGPIAGRLLLRKLPSLPS